MTTWRAIVRVGMGIACFQDIVCFVRLTMSSWTEVAILPRQDRITQENGKEEWDEHWTDRRSNCKLYQGRKAISALVYLKAFPTTAVPMLAMIWKTGIFIKPRCAHYLVLGWRHHFKDQAHMNSWDDDEVDEQVEKRHQSIWETFLRWCFFTLRKVFISGEKGKIFLSETVFTRGRSKAACTLCLACDPAQQQHSFGTNNK